MSLTILPRFVTHREAVTTPAGVRILRIPNRWCRKLRSTTGYKLPSLQDENQRCHSRSALSGLSPGVQVRTDARDALGV